jgi:hypothetical protein
VRILEGVMSRVKKIGVIGLAVLAVLVVAGWFFIFGPGSSAVHRWIVGQIKTIASDYLEPTLEFKDIRYVYPMTAIIDEPRLTAPDPENPGQTVDIFAAKQVTLEMAEIPRSGQPLRIQKLILDHPEMRVVMTSGPEGRIIGYSKLLKGPPSAEEAPRTPLSSVFEIRLVEILDGLVVYDPRRPGTKPMTLDQVTTSLAVQPSEGAEAGWYSMQLALDRKPVFDLAFNGRLNLDTMVLEARDLKLTAKLGRDQDQYLPPEIQEILKAHDVRGDLALTAKGSVPLTDPLASRLDAQLELTGARVTAGENQLLIDKLATICTVADRKGVLRKLDIKALGGTVEAGGNVALSGAMDASFRVQVTGLRIEQLLRNAQGEGAYKGAVSGNVDWQGSLAAVTTSSAGGGSIHLTDGQLGQVPILGDILAGVRKGMKSVHLDLGHKGDTANMEFAFAGDRVRLSKAVVVTDWAAVTGTGDIYMTSKLDLLLHAGPVEKLESMLGVAGDLLGKLTDQFAAFTVTGTLGGPKVGVKVAPGLKLP